MIRTVANRQTSLAVFGPKQLGDTLKESMSKRSACAANNGNAELWPDEPPRKRLAHTDACTGEQINQTGKSDWRLRLCNLRGKTLCSVDASGATTPNELKKVASQSFGAPPENLKLIAAGGSSPLCGNKGLSVQDVKDGDIITVIHCNAPEGFDTIDQCCVCGDFTYVFYGWSSTGLNREHVISRCFACGGIKERNFFFDSDFDDWAEALGCELRV